MVCDAGEHHAGPAVGPFGPKDVVPGNEGTRVCGEGSTTSTRRSARPAPKTWCPATKEQGIAGRGAPRPPGGRLVRSPRRGARRRRNKGLRGAKHHAGPSRRLHHSGRAPAPPADAHPAANNKMQIEKPGAALRQSPVFLSAFEPCGSARFRFCVNPYFTRV